MADGTKSVSVCELCGEPMPVGEEMFKYHGYSGPCPKPSFTTSAPRQAPQTAREWLDRWPDVIPFSYDGEYLCRMLEAYASYRSASENAALHHYLKGIAGCVVPEGTKWTEEELGSYARDLVDECATLRDTLDVIANALELKAGSDVGKAVMALRQRAAELEQQLIGARQSTRDLSAEAAVGRIEEARLDTALNESLDERDAARRELQGVREALGSVARLVNAAVCDNPKDASFIEAAREACEVALSGSSPATAPVPTDDGPCSFCGEPTDSLSGDPSHWCLRFAHRDGTGITKAHHMGCVTSRLFPDPLTIGAAHKISLVQIDQGSLRHFLRDFARQCIREAVEAEREACAELANCYHNKMLPKDDVFGAGQADADIEIAGAIRARARLAAQKEE